MLRKTGQGDLSNNAGSANDHSRNHGYTAPFDESGSDVQLPGSNESSLMSQQDDCDMEDLSQDNEAQEAI